MPSDDSRTSPQRYRQRTRVVAVIVSGVFALPALFVFGVTVRELSKPPEPSIYAAPPAAPGPSAEDISATAAPKPSSSQANSGKSTPPQPSDPLQRIPKLNP